MKHLIVLFIFLLTANSFSQIEQESSTSTFYFMRHAEKDRTDKTNRDPHLTTEGKLRAQRWSAILKHIKFDAVYSTNYNRTKETALPTATNNNLKLTLYHPGKINGQDFMVSNKGKTILIVGHSNTTPDFVNAILGKKKYKLIDDHNNGNLYIVTIINGKISDQVLTIN